MLSTTNCMPIMRHALNHSCFEICSNDRRSEVYCAKSYLWNSAQVVFIHRWTTHKILIVCSSAATPARTELSSKWKMKTEIGSDCCWFMLYAPLPLCCAATATTKILLNEKLMQCNLLVGNFERYNNSYIVMGHRAQTNKRRRRKKLKQNDCAVRMGLF